MLGVPRFVKEGLIVRLPAKRPNHQSYLIRNANRRAKCAGRFMRSCLGVYQDVLLRLDRNSQALHRLSIDSQNSFGGESAIVMRLVQEEHCIGTLSLFDADFQIASERLVK